MPRCPMKSCTQTVPNKFFFWVIFLLVAKLFQSGRMQHPLQSEPLDLAKWNRPSSSSDHGAPVTQPNIWTQSRCQRLAMALTLRKFARRYYLLCTMTIPFEFPQTFLTQGVFFDFYWSRTHRQTWQIPNEDSYLAAHAHFGRRWPCKCNLWKFLSSFLKPWRPRLLKRLP